MCMFYLQKCKFCIIIVLFLIQAFVSEANNVRIKGDVRVSSDHITHPGNVATFSFTVEWDHSWRDIFNYDGVYVFLKYKVQGEGEKWHHLYLMDEGNTLSSDLYGLQLKNSTSTADKNEGFFLYRSRNNPGTGTSSAEVTLKWLITSNPDRELTIADFDAGKVMMVAMGIEMVYVPRGAFRIGDTQAAHSFRNNYLAIPEKYDIVSSKYKITSSSPLGENYPDPYLAANRVNDLSAVKGENGYPSNAWYGDKVGIGHAIQHWTIDYGTPVMVKYLAIESVPGYVPDKWRFLGRATPNSNWDTIYYGTAADWETSLTRTYPTTKAFRVNAKDINYRYYRIYVNQNDMPGGSAGNPPLLKNVAMSTADLSQVVDNSVIVHSPTSLMGWQEGLAAADGDIWEGTTDLNYPNGYPAFWAMKYEISQEQYVTFLNKLTADQQRARTLGVAMENLSEGDYVFGNDRKQPAFRNGIRMMKYEKRGEPMVFDIGGTDVDPTLACNYLTPNDMLAYADWTGLRPMSEMEYEKMCRSFYPTEPLRGEYPWHTTSLSKVSVLADRATRAERPLNGAENVNFGAVVQGPLRCGAFVAGAQNREQTGAGFWGNMELAGNLAELYYNVNTEGRAFRGILAGQHGDGKLSDLGECNVTQRYWPLHRDAFCLKGGSWADTDVELLRVSDRTKHWKVVENLSHRDSTVTFRLGCTAPQVTYRTILTLQNGLSTGNASLIADTLCHSDSYTISGSLPEEMKDELYSVAWFVSENNGKSWYPVEGEGDQYLTLTKLWNKNTDENVIKEYRIRKEIYGLSGDAMSDTVVLRVLNTATYWNKRRDTLDVYDHSLALKVKTRQTADYQWMFDGKRQDAVHVIREGKSEVVAPRYAFLQPGDTRYILRSVFLNHCVTLDTIPTHVLPKPAEQPSAEVTCGNILVDKRDGKRYRTARIGTSCWMTDNLNYFVADSRCYDNRYENCEKYGRLYNWEQALGDWSDDQWQGICPEGWHVPSTNEWMELQQKTNGQSVRSQLNDWKLNTEETLANNDSRFSALPGGGYFFSYSTTTGSTKLGEVRIGYYDRQTAAWWWVAGGVRASYTSNSSAEAAKINIPYYATVDYKNTFMIGSSGTNSIFYGPSAYLGNSTAINADSRYHAMTAVQKNFYFNVRCVKDVK